MATHQRDNDSQYLNGVFSEDVVQSKDKKKIGIVIKTAKNDDSDSDSDSSDVEDEKIEPGKVMVGWYKMNNKWNDEDEVKVVNENSVELVDRSVLHGDIIRWVDKSKSIQKGQVQEVTVFCDLKIVGTNHTLLNVNAKILSPLEKFYESMPIIKGPWLGFILDVSHQVTLRLKNNSRCVISSVAVNSLHDITDQRDEDSTFYCQEFYAGQQVRGPASVFKDAKWISGLKPAVNNQRSIKAVVEEAHIEKIYVDWQVCGFTGNDAVSVVQPNKMLKANQLDDVKLLNHFKEASIQIGDKAYYTLTEDDVKACQENIKRASELKNAILAIPQTNEDIDSLKPDKVDSSDNHDSEDNDTDPTPVRSSIHVTRGGRRTASRPRRPANRNTHLQKKKKKYKPCISFLTGEKVCVEIILTKTFANVLWQNGNVVEDIPSTDLYPVLHLDELEFFPGDFVTDKREENQKQDCFGVIQTADFDNRLCSIRWLRYLNNASQTTNELEKNVSVYDVEDHKDYSFRTGDIAVRLASACDKDNESCQSLPPGGQVTRVNLNGMVNVIWSNDTVFPILPSRLYVLDREEDEDGNFNVDLNFIEDGDNNSVASEEWETASDSSELEVPFNGDQIGDISNNMNPLEAVIMRSLAALDTGGVSAGSNETLDDNNQVIGSDQRIHEFINELDSRFERPASNNLVENEVSESNDTVELCQGSVVTLDNAPPSHHYYGTTVTPINLRVFHTAIAKDLKLLKGHMPKGIYVKHFEDRMDLISILIVGPRATPYEDGLFSFDLQLPDGYPATPPNVFYHSYCSARLNPNLYEEGKVCISLLATWTGKGTETWTSKSTLHQLFLSIQGLILNEEPYYNEAGFEKQRGSQEGVENSRMYNEMATIKMLQSMIHMVLRPPEIFKEEVNNHFKEAVPRVIQRLNGWLSLENLRKDHSEIKEKPLYPLLPLSKGFCDTVKRLLRKLEECNTPS